MSNQNNYDELLNTIKSITQTEQTKCDIKSNAWQRIPALFRSLRNDCGLSQSEAARLGGVTSNAVCMLEAGRRSIGMKKLIRMIEIMTNHKNGDADVSS